MCQNTVSSYLSNQPELQSSTVCWGSRPEKRNSASFPMSVKTVVTITTLSHLNGLVQINFGAFTRLACSKQLHQDEKKLYKSRLNSKTKLFYVHLFNPCATVKEAILGPSGGIVLV